MSRLRYGLAVFGLTALILSRYSMDKDHAIDLQSLDDTTGFDIDADRQKASGTYFDDVGLSEISGNFNNRGLADLYQARINNGIVHDAATSGWYDTGPTDFVEPPSSLATDYPLDDSSESPAYIDSTYDNAWPGTGEGVYSFDSLGSGWDSYDGQFQVPISDSEAADDAAVSRLKGRQQELAACLPCLTGDDCVAGCLLAPRRPALSTPTNPPAAIRRRPHDGVAAAAASALPAAVAPSAAAAAAPRRAVVSSASTPVQQAPAAVAPAPAASISRPTAATAASSSAAAPAKASRISAAPLADRRRASDASAAAASAAPVRRAVTTQRHSAAAGPEPAAAWANGLGGGWVGRAVAVTPLARDVRYIADLQRRWAGLPNPNDPAAAAAAAAASRQHPHPTRAAVSPIAAATVAIAAAAVQAAALPSARTTFAATAAAVPPAQPSAAAASSIDEVPPAAAPLAPAATFAAAAPQEESAPAAAPAQDAAVHKTAVLGDAPQAAAAAPNGWSAIFAGVPRPPAAAPILAGAAAAAAAPRRAAGEEKNFEMDGYWPLDGGRWPLQDAGVRLETAPGGPWDKPPPRNLAAEGYWPVDGGSEPLERAGVLVERKPEDLADGRAMPEQPAAWWALFDSGHRLKEAGVRVV